jgi:hypothetical protein
MISLLVIWIHQWVGVCQRILRMLFGFDIRLKIWNWRQNNLSVFQYVNHFEAFYRWNRFVSMPVLTDFWSHWLQTTPHNCQFTKLFLECGLPTTEPLYLKLNSFPAVLCGSVLTGVWLLYSSAIILWVYPSCPHDSVFHAKGSYCWGLYIFLLRYI